MHTPWIGNRRIAVIPAVVNHEFFQPPPPGWVDMVRHRLLFDMDPISGIDRSVAAYISAVSYGKALLEADVLAPVTVPWSHCGATQDAAIQATPAAHAYEYACVVFMNGPHGCDGWAFFDNPPFPFDPTPSTTNDLRNWCYVSMGSSLGVWSMELLHTLTGFGDLYNTDPHPGNFDNMACSCGTHPSVYTKLKLGWLDPNLVHDASKGVRWETVGHADDVVAMAAINNKLFAATRHNKLWWRDPVGHDVEWEHIGHADDVVAMAAINNKLFAATRHNKLWWRDPVGHDVGWEHIGHANEVTAMAAIDNKLFCATSDNKLWWREAVGHDASWTNIGHADEVVAMAAGNGKLFAATRRNKLWWREPVVYDVKWEQIGHANDVAGMTCVDQKLFAATTDNKLWWRDPVREGTFTLHALGLPQPGPFGRVAGLRIPSAFPPRYFLVEARLRVDPYEQGASHLSQGIPSEGVVVYEIDEANWPVQLRTPSALSVGQKYLHEGSRSEIEVVSAVPGGFTVRVTGL